MSKRVAIMISGSGSNMAALVESMTGDHPAHPVLVLSNRPHAGGLAKAEKAGVPTVVVDHTPFGGDRHAFDAKVTETLEAAQPDIICMAGFMRIVTEDFATRWAGRMLNIHPSLLPKYRGLDTHARALAAGDCEHGCTVHEVTFELDGGPILGQASLRVAPDDTPKSLAARVLRLEHRLYPQVLRRFASGVRAPIFLKD